MPRVSQDTVERTPDELTYKDAEAAGFGSRHRLWKAIQAGKLPAFYRKGIVLMRREDLEAFDADKPIIPSKGGGPDA